MRRRFLPLAAAFSMMAAAAADEDQNGSAREAGSQATGERFTPERDGLGAQQLTGARSGDIPADAGPPATA